MLGLKIRLLEFLLEQDDTRVNQIVTHISITSEMHRISITTLTRTDNGCYAMMWLSWCQQKVTRRSISGLED